MNALQALNTPLDRIDDASDDDCIDFELGQLAVLIGPAIVEASGKLLTLRQELQPLFDALDQLPNGLDNTSVAQLCDDLIYARRALGVDLANGLWK